MYPRALMHVPVLEHPDPRLAHLVESSVPVPVRGRKDAPDALVERLQGARHAWNPPSQHLKEFYRKSMCWTERAHPFVANSATETAACILNARSHLIINHVKLGCLMSRVGIQANFSVKRSPGSDQTLPVK